MSCDSSDEDDIIILYYYLKRRKLERKKAKQRKRWIFNNTILRNVNKYETQQVDTDVYPQCDQDNMVQVDPLSLPGPSYECGDLGNIKVEFEEIEYKLDFEETETKLQHFGFIKMEVKEEPDEDQQETSSMYENVNNEENPQIESVPGEQSAVKLEESSTSASRAKRRRS